MRWYWPVDCDNTVSTPLVAETYDLLGIEDWELRRAQRIENWNNEAWLQARNRRNDGDPDDVLQSALDLPIYSSRLQEALSLAGVTGIQYLPVRVLRPSGEPIAGYAIANILNVVPALNARSSIVQYYGNDRPHRKGDVRSIRQVVLIAKNLVGYDVIRLAEYNVRIYVSERFKRAFEDAGCTGYSFHEVRTGEGSSTD